MGTRLGDILVKQGACSEDALRDALKNQIIFGGRLGTNLLEIQAVTEEALAKALGRQHGLPCVHGAQRPDPAAVALVPAELADRHEAVPLLVQGRGLAVVVVDPRNLAMLDEIAFATGKAVHPVVAPEARVWVLLREAYGVERHLRGLEVDFAKLKGRIDEARSVPPEPPPAAPAPDLMDEREFSALYARQLAPGAVPAAPPPAPVPAAGGPPQRAAPVAPGVPAPSPPAPPPAAAAPEPPPDEVIELTDLIEHEPWVAGEPPRVSPEVAADVLAALDRAPGHAPPPRIAPPARPEPEPSPLSFAEALRFLEGVDERDAIAKTVLRYARSRFQRAVLLTVHRGAAHGWAGLGERLGPEAVRRIHLGLGQPGILDTVVRAQAHFLGPLPKTESNIRLLKALGGGVPGNALLLPILAMGRVVNLLYVDDGRGATVDAGGVGELLILATRIAKSYDALLGRVR